MKEKQYRRSLRQAEILMQLEEKPAKTVTDLAERMGAQRPSISRSLRLLRDQGMVSRDRKGWQLTKDGKDESAAARISLFETSKKIKSISMRTNEIFGRMDVLANITKNFDRLIPLNDSIKIISKNMLAPKTMKLLNDAALAPITANAINKIIPTVDDILTRFDTKKIFGEVVRPLIEAQERNSILLGNLTAQTYLAGIDKIVKQNNLYLTGAIDNILTIHQAEMAKVATQVQSSIDFSWISTHLINVNQSFGHLFRDYLEKIEIPNVPTISLSLAEEIILPAATVNYYSDSLRDLVEAETEADIPPLPDQGHEEVGDQALDTLLCEHSPDFVDMRRGSWSVLQIGSPDRLRQAATSQRELIRQLLQLLVPDIHLPEGQRQGPQIKARVRIVLETSKSDTEFIEAVVQAVFSSYNQLNKYTHQNQKHEESLIALLRTGEGLIRFILAKKYEKSN